jgi:hypothetical protein
VYSDARSSIIDVRNASHGNVSALTAFSSWNQR